MFFQDKYDFLSNFYGEPPTVEHYFQAAKTEWPEEKAMVMECKTPGRAKRMGRRVTLHPEWHAMKLKVMEELLVKKFADKDLMDRLKMIKEDIEETNTWHDNYWGNCICAGCKDKPGQNILGKILMDIRSRL